MQKEVNRMGTRRRLLIVASLLTLILFISAAFYNGLVVRRYEINTPKIDPDDSIRIVLISDLHNHIYGENQCKIVSLIKKQKPDIIALAGDMADDRVPIIGTELFLAGVQGIAPIYYVTGNHEFWSDDIDNIKRIISEHNVTILENDYEQIDFGNSAIIIGGVDDPAIIKFKEPGYDWEKEFYNAFSHFSDYPEFKVLLTHRPELIDVYLKTDFDLVLSGHSHGGQVRIPFILNGLYAPNQGWFPKYAGGMYNHDKLIQIVSRGVSYNPKMPRVFNPPEIVVVDIKGM